MKSANKNTEIYKSCQEAFVQALSALSLEDLVDIDKEGNRVDTPACRFLTECGDVTLPFLLAPVVEVSKVTTILANRDIHEMLCELTYRFWLYCDITEVEVVSWLYDAADRTFARNKEEVAFADSLEKLEIMELINNPRERKSTLGVYMSVLLASVFYNDLKEIFERLGADE
jgi:hypothetical protein